MLFSPKLISMTPSSQPSFGQLAITNDGMHEATSIHTPRITLPVPICVLKSPRPTEESNLEKNESVSIEGRKGQRSAGCLLLAPMKLVFCCFVVEIASVLNCDIISLLWSVGAVAFTENLPCDAHCSC